MAALEAEGDPPTWGPFESGDTAEPLQIGRGKAVAAGFQVEGDFTGTVRLLASLDGENFHPLLDVEFDAPGYLEFTTAARWVKPDPIEGATVIISLAG